MTSAPASVTAVGPGPSPVWLERGNVRLQAPKPNAAPPTNAWAAITNPGLIKLLSHVAAAIGRYRAGEIDAYVVDETIHHYHRAAGDLWKFCSARSGGTHAELTAGLLNRMTPGAATIDWWERATPQRRQ